MRLLVCGDRNWTDKNKIRQEVIELCSIAHISVIIEGGARGADRLAGEVADELGISLLVFPANMREWLIKQGYSPDAAQGFIEGGYAPSMVTVVDGDLLMERVYKVYNDIESLAIPKKED
tara:strand:- start:36 stop:395 length:360 start_codon:yes stop_codon:yes gene_type:complete